jgi:hypothetical protein
MKMKKGTIMIIIAAIAAFMIYKFVFKQDKPVKNKEIPMAVTGTDTLTGDIGETLQAYYNMKDAFIKSDTALVNKEASVLVTKIDKMSFSGIHADTAVIGVAEQIQKDVSGETQNLLKTADIESKRKSFQIVSDGLFDLLRTIRYNGSKVFQQYCPMAFENAGAAWLSNSKEIVNPYFGDKMLHCGDVRDSVVIAKK